MKRSAEIERYLATPLKLVDVLSEVIKRKSQIRLSEIPADRLVQFNEISKAIDRLMDAGSEVPDEFRRLKIQLSHDASEHEKSLFIHQEALTLLKELEGRLSNCLTELRRTIVRMTEPQAKKAKARRYVKRTSPGVLAKEVRVAIRELGGRPKKWMFSQR